MTEHDSTADKRNAVDHLNFGSKTSKRTTWEAWEFSVEAPHLIRVTNAAYGVEKEDHSYLVGVEDRDGILVPAECECPADMYNEEYDCKHKVALATVGGSVVLEASVNFSIRNANPERSNASPVADKVRADGGKAAMETVRSDKSLNETKYVECDCSELGDLPCWECYQSSNSERV